MLQTPLIEASYRGNTKIVELLIAAGAHLDVQDDDGQVRCTAFSRSLVIQQSIPSLLAFAHCAVQSALEHAIMHCKTQSHMDTITALVKARANVNSADRHGLSPVPIRNLCLGSQR